MKNIIFSIGYYVGLVKGYIISKRTIEERRNKNEKKA
jgi:hypothetical protein